MPFSLCTASSLGRADVHHETCQVMCNDKACSFNLCGALERRDGVRSDVHDAGASRTRPLQGPHQQAWPLGRRALALRPGPKPRRTIRQARATPSSRSAPRRKPAAKGAVVVAALSRNSVKRGLEPRPAGLTGGFFCCVRRQFHKGAYEKGACRPPIEMSPFSPFEMSLSRVTDPPQRGRATPTSSAALLSARVSNGRQSAIPCPRVTSLIGRASDISIGD